MAFLSTIVWVFSLHLSWHEPSSSNSFLLLLGGKSSQQDITPKRIWAGTPEYAFPSLYRQTIPSLTSNPWPTTPILVGYRLMVFGLCACSTYVYFQSLFAAHAFVMVWRLVCAFCYSSLTSYGVNYFLISHSLWTAPFRGWALLDCGLFFLQPALLLLS